MKKGGLGGAKTQKAGADFETSTAEDLLEKLLLKGYEITCEHRLSGAKSTLHGVSLKSNKNLKIEIYYQDGIYKLFFEPRGIDWRKYYSGRLKPDSAIYSEATNTLTIIEKKQQEGAGSVAEKLQTCDYKMQYYSRLVKGLGIKVELVWQLGKYFIDQEANLKSVFEYMASKGSRYYFLTIPVEELNI
ncbi:MAG: hypothetical protein D4R69_03760 [Actinomycetales bacterium]|nr:MAG: hypothetical protein D4R69_03760 [Actinomycetales bacterium]